MHDAPWVPVPPDYEQHYLATLRWVNLLRGGVGLPRLEDLPRGVPGDPGRGPIARAMAPLGVARVTSRSGHCRDNLIFLLPPKARVLQAAFERGALPALQDHPTGPRSA